MTPFVRFTRRHCLDNFLSKSAANHLSPNMYNTRCVHFHKYVKCKTVGYIWNIEFLVYQFNSELFFKVIEENNLLKYTLQILMVNSL